MHKQINSGFTLVELSIVLVIIGLLVGGILKSQELIQNTRVKRFVTDVNAYETAMLTFSDIYRSLPGDIKNPGRSIPGCAALIHCSSSGGNGNGFIGSTEIMSWGDLDQSGLNTEPTQFWMHLKQADLVSGLTGEPSQEWGKAYPASPLGGGFQVVRITSNEFVRTNSFVEAHGHYLILRPKTTGSAQVLAPGDGSLNAVTAEKIDRIIDDGMPLKGKVIAYGGTLGTCINYPARRYLLADENTCIIGIRLNR